MHGPHPSKPYPLDGYTRAVFLKNFITRPNIEVGDYTYYDDASGAERFEERNVLHHFDFYGDRLVIGRFCALAAGTTFFMNGANHAMGGFSTYPFNLFGGGWEQGFDDKTWIDAGRGDTIVGNDVWIGNGALIMPGVTIGDGAIVAARSVVASDVPAYAVVAGNPAKSVRMRFDGQTVDALLRVAWWDWPAEKIARGLDAICGGDLDALKAIADKRP